MVPLRIRSTLSPSPIQKSRITRTAMVFSLAEVFFSSVMPISKRKRPRTDARPCWFYAGKALAAGGQPEEVSGNADARFVMDLQRTLTDEDALSSVTGLGEVLVLVDLAEPEEREHGRVHEEGIASRGSRDSHDAVRLHEHLAERTFVDVRIRHDAVVVAVLRRVAERSYVVVRHE